MARGKPRSRKRRQQEDEDRHWAAWLDWRTSGTGRLDQRRKDASRPPQAGLAGVELSLSTPTTHEGDGDDGPQTTGA